MRTTRLLTVVSRGGGVWVPGRCESRGGGCESQRDVCVQGICVSGGVCLGVSAGMCVQGVRVSRGCVCSGLCPRGCVRGVCPGDCVPAPGPEAHIPRPRSRHPPLWTERMTHACEIVTFPQLLLRVVKSQTGNLI